jgi:hypothetical protein
VVRPSDDDEHWWHLKLGRRGDVGHRCSLREDQEEDDDRTEVIEGFTS